MENIIQLNKQCVTNFITRIWNEQRFEEVAAYVSTTLLDHSTPDLWFQKQDGLVLYLSMMTDYIHHHSVIEELVSIDDMVIAKIRMTVNLTKADVSTPEIIYILRLFRLTDAKISEHWEFSLNAG